MDFDILLHSFQNIQISDDERYKIFKRFANHFFNISQLNFIYNKISIYKFVISISDYPGFLDIECSQNIECILYLVFSNQCLDYIVQFFRNFFECDDTEILKDLIVKPMTDIFAFFSHNVILVFIDDEIFEYKLKHIDLFEKFSYEDNISIV